MSRDWTQDLMARSVRTRSQLSNSVKARLMPSLTSKSFCSPAAISTTSVSSSTGARVLNELVQPDLRLALGEDLRRLREELDDDDEEEDEEWRDVGGDGIVLKALDGETEGDATAVEALV